MLLPQDSRIKGVPTMPVNSFMAIRTQHVAFFNFLLNARYAPTIVHCFRDREFLFQLVTMMKDKCGRVVLTTLLATKGPLVFCVPLADRASLLRISHPNLLRV